MKNNLLLLLLIFNAISGFSQAYEFETIIDLEATDVISQGRTGTCWSFSTSSFLESEIMRQSGKQIDLSEMYTVRQTYPKKAWIYVMRQGKAQFSEGGLAHDVINSIANHGIVPNTAYPGLKESSERHDHSKMVDTLKKMLDAYKKKPSGYKSDWKQDVEHILDSHLGETITTFNYEGIQYTPQSFLEMTQLNPKDYVTITSFTHKPYYSNFILNIPDNFSNGSFYNVPLDNLINVINSALEKGYTIELDCDVSEKTFSSKHGVAVIPEDDAKAIEALTSVQKEKEITPEYRQQEFENYHTTDDHLMHITGRLKDQNGTTYYKVKNSWGNNSERVSNGGYIYMSEAYMRLKTISVMVHKDALPESLQPKLILH
jgi:bleomycin hydrolase